MKAGESVWPTSGYQERSSLSLPDGLRDAATQSFAFLSNLALSQPALGPDVWELLLLLPIDESLLAALLSEHVEVAASWERVFDPTAPYSLLYALSLLNDLLNNAGAWGRRFASQERFVRWCRAFVERGGLAFLLNLFRLNTTPPTAPTGFPLRLANVSIAESEHSGVLHAALLEALIQAITMLLALDPASHALIPTPLEARLPANSVLTPAVHDRLGLLLGHVLLPTLLAACARLQPSGTDGLRGPGMRRVGGCLAETNERVVSAGLLVASLALLTTGLRCAPDLLPLLSTQASAFEAVMRGALLHLPSKPLRHRAATHLWHLAMCSHLKPAKSEAKSLLQSNSQDDDMLEFVLCAAFLLLGYANPEDAVARGLPVPVEVAAIHIYMYTFLYIDCLTDGGATARRRGHDRSVEASAGPRGPERVVVHGCAAAGERGPGSAGFG